MHLRNVRCILSLAALSLMICGVVAHAGSSQHTKLFLFQVDQNTFADFSIVKGSSAKLTRSGGEVWIKINTTGLPPGAYTNWWVIFNNPAACIDGCDVADLFSGDPAIGGSILFATGGIISHTGVGHFTAHLAEGELPTLPGQVFLGTGLTDAQGAEIHYILKTHGAPSSDPEILDKQLTTVYGGCIGGPNHPEDPVPEHRLFECYDPQAAAFPAP
jgi:hypothetical protein